MVLLGIPTSYANMRPKPHARGRCHSADYWTAIQILSSWREIREQGYNGSERTVYRYLETLKQAEVKASANLHRIQKFSANTAVWLFVRNPKTLDEIEREDLAAFCQTSTTLKRAYDLIQDFLRMVHQREGERLDAWRVQIAESGLAELQSFAAGIEKDKDAVRAYQAMPHLQR